MGAALGIISGSTNLELVQCDFCGADNGEQPKGEIKRKLFIVLIEIMINCMYYRIYL